MKVPVLINSIKRKSVSVILAVLISAMTAMPVSAASDAGETLLGDNTGNTDTSDTAESPEEPPVDTEPETTEDTEEDGNTPEETGTDTSEEGEIPEETGTEEGGEAPEETSAEKTEEGDTSPEDTTDNESNKPAVPEIKTAVIDGESFPDDIFRAYISTFDTDEDGLLSESEIVDIRFVYVNGTADTDGGITSLKGIELLPALETLDCSYNASLEELDVSLNRELTTLDCSFTGITELDLSGNPALTCLLCSDTGISSLDLSNNTELTVLHCLNTRLPYLDLTNNLSIETLEASGTYEIPSNAVTFDFNEIEGIDISKIVSAENAVFDPETGMLYNITDDVNYIYQCNEELTAIFTLTLTGEALDEEEKLLYIDNGSITITENGFVQNGRETAWTKDYIISYTGEEPISAFIAVESGSHHITLDNVKITGEKEVITIAEGAEVTLDGNQILIIGENGSGIVNGGILHIESGEYTVNNNMVKNGENSSSTVENKGVFVLGENAVITITAGIDSPEDNIIVTKALVNGFSNSGISAIYGTLTARGGSGVFNEGDLSVYEGGSITAKGDEYGVFSIAENGVLEVCGGRITSAGSIDGINIYSGTFAITSGIVDTQGSRVGICIQEDAQMNISGGRVKTTCDYGIENYGKIYINGSMTTAGGEIYDIFSGENASFTVTGGSLQLENGTMSEYALIVNEAEDELECKLYEEYPEEDARIFGAEGMEYLYALTDTDCDENGLYYLWIPAKLLSIDETNFPDDVFRAYIKDNFDTNKDGGLSQREINRVLNIFINGTSAEDGDVQTLEGIEYFTNLETLDCSYNAALTELDLSANGLLKVLDFSGTGISRIDLSGNSKLTELRCNYSKILFLDLTNNPDVTILQAEGCGFKLADGVTEFDLSTIEGLDISKIANVNNADYDPSTGIISNIRENTSYDYACNEQFTVNIAVIGSVSGENTGSNPEPPEETTTEYEETTPEETTAANNPPSEGIGGGSGSSPEETTEPDTTVPEETGGSEPLPEETTAEENNPEETTGGAENPEETTGETGNPEETTTDAEETTKKTDTEPEEALPIDINNGSVIICEDGFMQGEEFTQWSGGYIISGDGSSVTVESGIHNITLDNADLKAESGALHISESARVSLSGKGINTLTGETGCGISNNGILDIINGDFEVYDNITETGEAGSGAVENTGVLRIGEKALVTASASFAQSDSSLAGGKKLYGGILNSGSLEINGDLAADGNCGIINEGSISIQGGSITSTGNEYGVFSLNQSSAISISGGNVSFKGGNCGTNIFGGSMNISSGDVKSAGDRVGISVQTDTELTVSGGTLATTCDYGIENYGSIAVTGGSVNISGDISDLYGSENSSFEAAEGTVTFKNNNEKIIMDITWPTSTYVIINPYGMELNTKDGEVTAEKVISPEMIIVNNGNTDISINVTGSVSVADKINHIENDMIRFADDAEYYSYSEDDSLLLWIESAKISGGYSYGYDNTSAAQMILGTRSMTKRLLTIPSDGGEGYLKIRGDVTVAPTGSVWDNAIAGNEINVAIAFEAKATPKVKEKNPDDYATVVKSDNGEDTIYVHS